jgi:hypothetical protein
MGDAQVGPAALEELLAHRQPNEDGDAREQQRERARGAARDPEEVLGDHQDWLVVTLEPWLEEEELPLFALLEVEPESLVLADDVVAGSSEVAFACCDALLDVVEPR